jgi:hypothetical protein
MIHPFFKVLVKSVKCDNLLHGDVNLYHSVVVLAVHYCNNFCYIIWECVVLAFLKNLVGICDM